MRSKWEVDLCVFRLPTLTHLWKDDRRNTDSSIRKTFVEELPLLDERVDQELLGMVERPEEVLLLEVEDGSKEVRVIMDSAKDPLAVLLVEHRMADLEAMELQQLLL